MKGNANAPCCGFSTRMVESLKKHGKSFGDCDSLTELDSRIELAKLIAKGDSE